VQQSRLLLKQLQFLLLDEAGSLKETLVGAEYLMSLDIGRESGTWMPPQWGASGKRLELDLLIEFDADGRIAAPKERALGSILS
jgi:hypothetical protein